MNFIKKHIQLIVGIIIGMVLVSGISVYATYNYFANEVSYIKSDGTKISVENALNELYEVKKDYIKPEGTFKLTTPGNQIDISAYQYLDTTGLRTEALSGIGTTDSKGTITIKNLGFKPSEVWALIYGDDKSLIIQANYLGAHYWAYSHGQHYYAAEPNFYITKDGFTYTAQNWGNSNISWTAVK